MFLTGTMDPGPFEATKVSIYAMAMGLLEDAVMEKMLEDPEKREILLKYLLSDPRLKTKTTQIN